MKRSVKRVEIFVSLFLISAGLFSNSAWAETAAELLQQDEEAALRGGNAQLGTLSSADFVLKYPLAWEDLDRERGV